MKKTAKRWGFATAIAVLIVGCGAGLTRTRLTAKDKNAAASHYFLVAPIRDWGFSHSVGGETQVAYPPGEPDGNAVFDRHQYGPITDVRDHPRQAPAKH